MAEQDRLQKLEQPVFWVDKVAREIIGKNPKTKKFRCEMGLGASGIPHIGSAGDGVRSYVVYLALKQLKKNAEFIAYADDRDGLRKVPMGFPEELNKEIGRPVSLVPDYQKCHKSLAEHIESILIDAFEKLGVKFKLRRGHLEYAKGTFDKEVIEILTKAEDANRVIKETTGSEKFESQLPYFPICEKCGSILVTRAHKFNPKNKKISYDCDGEFTGKNINTGQEIIIRGCGHKGECGIRDGKLAWKVEFAARWRALEINYEAYGADILDSVRCNDAISRQILNSEPPVHSFYELFTERSGKKISKSAGNVFTVQTWLKYASPESVRLLYLKKLAMARVVDPDAIPAYQDEVDELAKVYFGEIKPKIQTDFEHNKRIYEYVNFLNVPQKKPWALPYGLLTNIIKLVKDKKLAKQALAKTGHIGKLSKAEQEVLEGRLSNVYNWVQDTVEDENVSVNLSDLQKKGLHKISDLLHKDISEEDLQAGIFAISKELGLPAGELFKAAYLVLLKSERGPRLASLILAIGRKKVAEMFEQN